MPKPGSQLAYQFPIRSYIAAAAHAANKVALEKKQQKGKLPSCHRTAQQAVVCMPQLVAGGGVERSYHISRICIVYVIFARAANRYFLYLRGRAEPMRLIAI